MTRQVKSSAATRATVQITDVSRFPLTFRGPGRSTAKESARTNPSTSSMTVIRSLLPDSRSQPPCWRR